MDFILLALAFIFLWFFLESISLMIRKANWALAGVISSAAFAGLVFVAVLILASG